jgi:ribosomal-protein-alanine N-acetyltransferase
MTGAMTTLTTARLTLRPKSPDHFVPMHAMVSDFDVVKWTATWPFPPDPAYTLDRLGWPQPENGLDALIFEGDAFAGTVHIAKGMLGYMLPRSAWGRGIATEACAAILDWAFAQGHETVTAGTFDGNDASAHVLGKLGFTQTGRGTLMCRARAQELPGPDFALTRANWLIRRPIEFPAPRA